MRKRNSTRPGSRTRLFYPLAVFLLALGLRLLALYLLEPIPLWSDSLRHHHQPAARFVRSFGFLSQGDRFVQEVRKAYNKASYKGEVTSAFFSSIYLVSGVNPHAVRIAQSGLDSFSCVLIYLLALRVLSSFPAAIMAGSLAAIYPPFIHSSGDLLTDTLGMFLIISSIVLLYRGMDKRRYLSVLLAGVLTALAMLCRAAFLYIAPFIFLPYFIIAGLQKTKMRTALLRFLVYVLGISTLIIPRLLITNSLYGRPYLGGTVVDGDSGKVLFSGINRRGEGFRTDDDEAGVEVVQELLHLNENQFPSFSDYCKAYLIVMRRNPLSSFSLLASKFYLFWTYPFHIFKQGFPLNPRATRILHSLIFTAGLFGLCFSFKRRPLNLVILSPLLYLSSLAIVPDFFPRPPMSAMPFIIILAAYGIYNLLLGIKELLRMKLFLKFALLALPPVALLSITSYLSIPFLMSLIKTLNPTQCFAIHSILLYCSLIAFIPLIFFIARVRMDRTIALWASFIPIFLGIISIYGFSTIHPVWHEWKTRLDKPGLAVRQEIRLPRDIRLYRRAALKIHMRGGGRRDYDLEVRVDGESVKIFRGGLTADGDQPLAILGGYYTLFHDYHGKGIEEVPQWFTIPLAPGMLAGKETIIVELSREGTAYGEENYVEIFGDYVTTESPGTFEGPSWSRERSKTSADKYITMGDFRIWGKKRLEGRISSSLLVGEAGQHDDLSPSRGRQTGRFRIFLDLPRHVNARTEI